MSVKNAIKPTDSELEILQVLWEHGPASVRFVNDKLNEMSPKEIGYTTTLKIMQIMAEKNLVSRNTESRTHIYSANVNESKTQQDLLNSFVDSAFRGKAMKMVMQALGNHRVSASELQEIKDLIQKIEQKK